jgi:hypothetical protein
MTTAECVCAVMLIEKEGVLTKVLAAAMTGTGIG